MPDLIRHRCAIWATEKMYDFEVSAESKADLYRDLYAALDALAGG